MPRCFQVRIEAALFGEHRFAFHHARYAMPREDAGDDRVVLGRVASPVDLGAELRGGGFELLEVFVEPRHRVELDPRRQIAQRFPLGDRLRGPIALGTRAPDRRVVPTHLRRVGDELRGGGGMVGGLMAHGATCPASGLDPTGFREDFGDVHDADRFLLAADEAVEVHQARHVGRRQHFGAGPLVVGDSIEAHHA